VQPISSLATLILLFVAVTACLLRFWAMATLKEFFTPGLRVKPGQTIIQTGPYKIVRHPGYLGGALITISSGVAIHPTLITFLLMIGVYLYAWKNRIRIEEEMLSSSTPEYEKYKQRVPYALLPFVF
jgi:protein-S-isoprenylcysteine O-methyltransferase Ste14